MAPTSGNFCTLVLGLDICTCCEFGAICVRQSADLFDFEITLLWADQMFPSSSFLSIDFSAASIVSRCLICLTSISSFLWFDFHKGFLCCLYCVFVWFWVHLLLPLIWFLCCLYCVSQQPVTCLLLVTAAVDKWSTIVAFNPVFHPRQGQLLWPSGQFLDNSCPDRNSRWSRWLRQWLPLLCRRHIKPVLEEEMVGARSESRSVSVSSILVIVAMLLKSATTTSTDLERSRIGFQSWPLKKLETPFVNFASAGETTTRVRHSDITGGEKVTFELTLKYKWSTFRSQDQQLFSNF